MTLRAILFGFVVAVAPLAAAAHAFLQRANPSAGQELHGSPAKIELIFSETLEGAFSGIAVTDTAGHDMAAGAMAANGAKLELLLKKLKPGRYRVSWHAVSVDAHRTEGKYNFLVAP